MLSSKKDTEEKLIIDYFREIYTGFPKGRLIKSESPDFILKQGRKKTTGIELTRLDDEAVTLKERIENTLEKKDRKIASYQTRKFNTIWLIIHTDFIKDSKSYNHRNKLNKWEFYSKFDKVFLFDLFNKTFFEII
ncbi:MAG: hypothetical protein B6D61_04430 [Bacteroidetes bacterium 4484_249]|nr:MAG: hypothetical protein B6D61_04430 [Bacteroidetes bacterium 4484_249]